MAGPQKLLFSVDDIEIDRDVEMFTETYFVSLGFAVTAEGGRCKPVTSNEPRSATSEALDLLIPFDAALGSWFHVTTSPLFRIRRRRVHPFVGGLPMYYGAPGVVSSIYVAVMEGDKNARKAGEVLAAAMSDLPTDGVFAAIGKLASAGAAPELALVKEAFSLVVKIVEQALINNRDDIQYTNVFTFKASNNYLRGVRKVNNHKVSLTVSAETV
jgi:hypothetical protein